MKKLIAGILAAGVAAAMVGCSESPTSDPSIEPATTANVTEMSTAAQTPTSTEEPAPEPTADIMTVDQPASLPGGVTYNYSAGWILRGDASAEEVEADATEATTQRVRNIYGVVSPDGTHTMGAIGAHLSAANLGDNELWETAEPLFVNQEAKGVAVESMSRANDEVTVGHLYVGNGSITVDGETIMTRAITFVIGDDIYQFVLMSRVADMDTMMELWTEVVNSVEYNGTRILVNPLSASNKTSDAVASAVAEAASINSAPAEKTTAEPAL